MVNVDVLNKTIENLDVKSKEIENIVEKQKKFEILAKEIEIIKSEINKDKNNMLITAKKIDDIINKSKNTALEVENIINNKLIEISSKVSGYNDNITKLTINAQTIDEDVKSINIEVVKKLNEMVGENYKLINEFHSALDAKLGLMKSEIALDLRKIQEKIESDLKKNNEKIDNVKETLEKEIKASTIKIEENIKIAKETNKEEMMKLFKKEQVLIIAVIAIGVVNIIVSFVKLLL